MSKAICQTLSHFCHVGLLWKSPLAASHFDYISKVIEVMKVHYVKGKYFFTYLVKLTQFIKNNPTLDSRISAIYHTMYFKGCKNRSSTVENSKKLVQQAD